MRKRAQEQRGQAMIFFAILLPVLALTTGVVVEGGRVFVEYRKLQSAADMAAIVSAQKLPCNTTDTSCITTVENDACTYAANNGFASCTAGGSNAPSSNVPPVSCSPYDFLDYGNGATNASCKASTSPPFYDYVEVRLTDQLGTIPIFNIPVTLSTHAVAKHGIPSSGDYAIISLDPNTPLDLYGDTHVQTIGSNFANGGISGNDKGLVACDGGWFSANGTVSGVDTNTSGSPVFAPTGCTGSDDSTPLAGSGYAQISDPYAASVPPNTLGTGGGAMTNCSECSQPGWWYDGSKWHQGGSPSGGTIEMFPGVYDSLSLGNNDQVYFNPGVYTFDNGGVDNNHGTMCIFGSPSCLNDSCSTDSFSQGTDAANQWYYSCSPYGYWDSSSFNGTRPASLPTTAPDWYGTSTPLNGVTFYIPQGSGGITTHGNGGKTGDIYLAAPNPCPGTGSFTTNPNEVSDPQGSASGVYSYQSGDYAAQQGFSQSATGVVYPSYDFSLAGECNESLQVWAGEMPKPQHLHFLIYMTDNSSSTLNGASSQQLTGIIYAPNSSISVNGAGKGAGGPPWIDGQLVMYNGSFGGNSTTDVSYRSCGPGSTACGSGGGTELVQ